MFVGRVAPEMIEGNTVVRNDLQPEHLPKSRTSVCLMRQAVIRLSCHKILVFVWRVSHEMLIGYGYSSKGRLVTLTSLRTVIPVSI